MTKRILIVGGGVIGLFCAYFAVRAGHRVTLLERNELNRDMASLGNAGMIVPSHFVPLATPDNVKFGLRNVLNPESPFYIRPRVDKALLDWGLKFMRAANPAQIARAERLLRDMSLASRAHYEQLATEMDFGLVKKGLLMLCNTAEGLHHEAAFAQHANALGVPAEVLTAEQTRALDPGVSFDIAGAVHFPHDCHLSPGRLIAELTRWLEAHGVDIQYGRTQTGWQLQNGRVVALQSMQTDMLGVMWAQGVKHPDALPGFTSHDADEYVIAGGAWSDGVARPLGAELPLQGGKGYSLTLAKPRQLPQLCAILVEARAAVTPMGDTLRVGGTMEIAGLDESINPRRVRGIIKSFVKYYNAFAPQDFEAVKPWRGLRPVSPDGLPYIGRLPGHPNVCVAAGHAMLGLSLAPVTGALISEIIGDHQPALAIDPVLLAPGRFA
jgi:D-amino-acid dehydrogenase